MKGNDTLISDSKSDVLLIGGSGNDSLIMFGGNGTLSGGKGSDTFELTYSAVNSLSAVIEDFDPSSDKIVINHVGDTAPQLTSVASGNDVVWKDSEGYFNLTLKSVRDNDYFDGFADNDAWEAWKVLKLTNEEREAKGLSPLTLSEGLMTGASIRAEEIIGSISHTRPNGTIYYTVLNDKYDFVGENLEAGAATPKEVMDDWISSKSHYANIKHERFTKLGLVFNYYDADPSDRRYYWAQLFASPLNVLDTVSTAELLKASIQTHAVSKAVELVDDVYNNTVYGATIDASSGDDTINNTGAIVSIVTGDGDDTITNDGANATITAGLGNDSISLGSDATENLLVYRAGDGNDTVFGFNENDTLNIVGGSYIRSTVVNNVIFAVGTDSIILVDAASLGTSLNIIGEGQEGDLYSGLINLTNGNDTYHNSIETATIKALGGATSITNDADKVTIKGSEGNDSISNSGNGDYTGWDENGRWHDGGDVVIYGGKDKDFISNTGNNVIIYGDNSYDDWDDDDWDDDDLGDDDLGDDDTICSSGSDVTIEGGTGDDLISLSSDANKNLIQYTVGDGNDTIIGFKTTDTLSIQR